MKNSLTVLTALMLAVVTGCSQGTPGGPGTADRSANPVYGQADNTFNLTVPIMSSSLRQGENAKVSVGIKRAKDFDEDVSLQFSDVPKGVTIEPANVVIKHGETEAKFEFKAEDKASLGDFKVTVTGHPEKGSDAVVNFKLNIIAEKEAFTLSTPRVSTSLKQGETKNVKIGISREKNFDQDVALSFGALPTGVTLEPAAPVIKNGDTDAEITFTSADDAALGNFDIKMTGRPTTGNDSSNEIKLTVVKR